MKIVGDAAIPFIEEAFGGFGTLSKLESKSIDKSAVRDADALIIRSETKVDEKLLSGSKVRFVGTATIGTDHVDVECLRKKNIAFASAPGSNANAVVQYVLASLFLMARRKQVLLKGKTLGVVGVGNVGSKIVRVGEKLGMKVLQNDPPLERISHNPRFISLDDLMTSDFITVHVPLTRLGPDPTFHLFDKKRLSLMKKGSALINSSRGGVVDNASLKTCLFDGTIGDAVLDVWENEPNFDTELLSVCDIGTPHIAGYSIEGKVNATKMILQAFCNHFGLMEFSDFAYVVSQPQNRIITIDGRIVESEEVLANIISECYDIERDDRALRAVKTIEPDERGKFFKRLRAEYNFRHEFSSYRIQIRGENGPLAEILHSFGFIVEVVPL